MLLQDTAQEAKKAEESQGAEVEEEGLTPEDECILSCVFSEAVAIPSYHRQGRRIIVGLGAQPTHAKTAIEAAVFWVEKHLDVVQELVGKPPYIDFLNNTRLHQDGRTPGDPIKGNCHVNVFLHVPPHASAFFLAPSMVIAIVMMVWRLPSEKLKTWSAVGSFDLMGRLHGYPDLGDTYVKLLIEYGIDTLLVSSEQLKDDPTDLQGLNVICCENVLDMVRLVVDFVVRGIPPSTDQGQGQQMEVEL